MPATSATRPSTSRLCVASSNVRLVKLALTGSVRALAGSVTVTSAVEIAQRDGTCSDLRVRTRGDRDGKLTELVTQLHLEVDVDRLAAANRARRDIEAGDGVAQLGRVLPPIDVAFADAHARQARTRVLAGAAGASGAGVPLAARARSCQLPLNAASRARLSVRPSSSTVPISNCPDRRGINFTRAPARSIVANGWSPNPAALPIVIPPVSTASHGKKLKVRSSSIASVRPVRASNASVA